MRRKLSSLVGDGLERDELVGCLVGAGVERELDVHVAFLVLGREFLLGGDGVAVGVDDRLSGLLVHERAGDLVGLAGGHALVMDGVDHRDVGLADDVLVAVELVDCGRLELRLGDIDGLVHIVKVRMDGKLGTLVEQRLESDELVALGQSAGIEVENNLDVAFAALGRELGLGRDDVACIVGQCLAGGLVHERACDLVGLAWRDILIVDLVLDSHVGLASDALVAIENIGRRRLELGLDDGDRLVDILEVGVHDELLALIGQRLEDDQGVALLIRSAVKREKQVNVALGFLRRELKHRGDGIAVLVLDRLSGLLVHERAGDLVGLAGGHALVMDGVDHRDVGLADDVLVAVELVDCGRLELGLGDGDRLVLVLEVGVNAYFDALVGH